MTIGYHLENDLISQGFLLPCGTDEAGRGPLAGPVVAAAVILDPDRIPDGIDDSKKLSARRRRAIHFEIRKTAAVSVCCIGAGEIDETDIRKATLEAMRRAVAGLTPAAGFVLADGRDVPPGLAVPARAVIKGDSTSLSIAAASIVAKTVRDRIMETACAMWPGYGFAKHAGYGTRDHLAAIDRLGPCPIHRRSFAPLKHSPAAAA